MLAQKKPLRSPIFLLLGAGAALFALLPWAITGMRLPLQQLWSQQTLPEDMPIALLPFHMYFALTVAALIVIGSTIAGLIGRNVAARHPRSALGALVGGVVGVQVIATAQTSIVLLSGLQDSRTSMLYLTLLVGGTIAAILLGLGMLLLIARGPKAGALLALSIAAIAFTTWMNALFFPIGGYREWGLGAGRAQRGVALQSRGHHRCRDRVVRHQDCGPRSCGDREPMRVVARADSASPP